MVDVGEKSCQSHKRKPNYYYFAPIRRRTSRVLFVSFNTSCHRQLFGFKTFSRAVYFSNLSLPSVHKGLRGICSRNLEIKCGAKRVHEDGVTYQRGILESPEPNSQLVLCFL